VAIRLWVPHDVKGLIGLMGKDEFVRRLDQGFEGSRPDFAHGYVNVGNQPNMQAPWLFNYAGAPWLTQKWTREVMDHSYTTEPAGYTGDEDQGQMGSYYVLMAMGLFEMDGGCSQKPIYEIGSPLFLAGLSFTLIKSIIRAGSLSSRPRTIRRKMCTSNPQR
jgi:putative alpha-1,2-mannosidase